MSAGREASGTTRLYVLIDDWCSQRKMSLSEFARQAGVDRQTVYNLRNGRTSSNMRSASKEGIEDALGWEHGSVDRVLAGGDPIPLATAEAPPRGSTLRGVPLNPEPTFDMALEAYGQALQQLRRVATTDPNVPAKALNIIEDWEMMYTALMFGGVDAVMRAIADSYRRGLPGESSHGQTG